MTLLSLLSRFLDRARPREAGRDGPPTVSASRRRRGAGRLEPAPKPRLAELRFPVLPPPLW